MKKSTKIILGVMGAGALIAASNLKSTPKGLESQDISVSKVQETSYPPNAKRKYVKFCNKNDENPPVSFVVTVGDSEQVQIPQGSCYEDAKTAAEQIYVFSTTTVPSLAPAPLSVTIDE